MVDPSNRLVAAELERRWNQALTKEAEVEAELIILREQREEPITEERKRESDTPRGAGGLMGWAVSKTAGLWV